MKPDELKAIGWINHMRKVLNGEEESIDYIDLEKLLDFTNFDFALWFEHEKNVLEPQLVAMGYRNIDWRMGEYDSFGPLTRVASATDPDGKVVWFIYG